MKWTLILQATSDKEQDNFTALNIDGEIWTFFDYYTKKKYNTALEGLWHFFLSLFIFFSCANFWRALYL